MPQRQTTSRGTRIARLACVAAVACALTAGAGSAPVANATSAAPAAKTTSAAAKAKQRALARKKARIRSELRKAIKRNPIKALRSKTFMKRAQFSELAVPATVRLRPGTQLATTILPNRWPLDEPTHPVPSGEQLLDVGGQFSSEIQFGNNGYGIVGTLQSRSGQKTQLSSLGPLRLAELDCGLTPPDPRPAFIEATPAATIGMSSGGLSWMNMNPFTGQSGGYLYLNWSFTSRVLRSDATCASPGDSADFSIPGSLPSTAPLPYQPIRVEWNGSFRVAPAITPDGALRFGKIVADNAVTGQPATTGNLWSCAPTALVGSQPAVPAGATCTEQSAPLVPPMEEMTATPFATQFQFKTFYAEVLLGNVPLPGPSVPLVPGP